jgi:hypothetical protein
MVGQGGVQQTMSDVQSARKMNRENLLGQPGSGMLH